jgi:hypothetical protein
MFARTLEEIQSSAPKRAIYLRALLATLAICVGLTTIGLGVDMVSIGGFVLVALIGSTS